MQSEVESYFITRFLGSKCFIYKITWWNWTAFIWAMFKGPSSNLVFDIRRSTRTKSKLWGHVAFVWSIPTKCCLPSKDFFQKTYPQIFGQIKMQIEPNWFLLWAIPKFKSFKWFRDWWVNFPRECPSSEKDCGCLTSLLASEIEKFQCNLILLNFSPFGSTLSVVLESRFRSLKENWLRPQRIKFR